MTRYKKIMIFKNRKRHWYT